MGFLTPDDIKTKAERAYPRFLTHWVSGAAGEFFPYRVRARFLIDATDPKGTIRASEALMEKSKAARGWGYTVYREQVRMRDFGNNPVPRAITIDSQEDLLRLTHKQAEFEATCQVTEAVRAALPTLSEWLKSNVRSLHILCGSVTGLVHVAQYFISHPWPDCYARQLPISVDSKFVQRHQGTLRQWLDLLLPASAVDVNETDLTPNYAPV